MSIVFLGKADDSNTSNRVARAMNRHVGYDLARCVAINRSKCEYDEDIVLNRDPDGWSDAHRLVVDADWVMHLGDDDYGSYWKLLCRLLARGAVSHHRLRNDMRRMGKRWGTRHCGSLFRDNTLRYRRWDDAAGFEARFVPMDLMRLVEDEPLYRPFLQPQGDDMAEELPEIEGPLSVCHTPSNPGKKRTDLVEAGVAMVDVQYERIAGVPYAECAARRRKHHVVIDHMNGHHGSVGAATMEALAQGQVVLTNDTWMRASKTVEQWFPFPPTVTVETPDDVAKELRRLSNQDELQEARQSSLDWAHAYLSDKFTAEYWLDALR